MPDFPENSGQSGGGIPPVANRTVWVDANKGNDSTAVIGRPDQPYRSILTAAAAAASVGGRIRLRPGVYEVGTTGLVVSNITGIYGDGMCSCVITGHTAAGRAMLDVRGPTAVELSGFAVLSSHASTLPLKVGVSRAPKVILRNLRLRAKNDALAYSGAGFSASAAQTVNVKAFNCQFASGFDTFNCNGTGDGAANSTFEFHSCRFTPEFDGSQFTIRAIANKDAMIALFGCRIVAKNGRPNYGVVVEENGAGAVFLTGTAVISSSTNCTPYTLANFSTRGGRIVVRTPGVDPASTFGPIEYDYGPKGQGYWEPRGTDPLPTPP